MNPECPLHVRLVSSDVASGIAEPILRSVPAWFGIESSTLGYIEAASRHPTLVAFEAQMPVGFLTLTQHYPRSAEIHCMAVRLDRHGRGIGTALVHAADQQLAAAGVKMLQVKTQGPSLPCEEYARTTRFYLAMGFVELEEVHGLWYGIPTLILVKAIERAN